MRALYPLAMAKGEVTLSGVPITSIASRYGTPTYAYSLDVIGERYDSLFRQIGWPRLGIFYAMKANSNVDILRFLKGKGSGIDAVSYGDVLLARRLGFPPGRIIYTANNVVEDELDLAAKSGATINIGDIPRLESFGRSHPGAGVCIRVNPEVLAGEHELVRTAGALSKFGILPDYIPEAKRICRRHSLRVIGIHEHTGSGIKDTSAIFRSVGATLELAKGFPDLEFVDFGGGFKVRYDPREHDVDYGRFGMRISGMFSRFCESYGRRLEMRFEPGKYLVSQCGVLVVRVNTVKDNRGVRIAGVDSGFSQLIRPVLYGAYHHIANCSNPGGRPAGYTVAGDICEGGDVFARDRPVPRVREGDVLAIQNAGAYCYSMASTYNNRPLPAEVVVSHGRSRLSTRRPGFGEFVRRQYGIG